MAVSVIIGITNKRINSTSTQFADSVNLSCRLKEPCSQQNPVFIVQGLSKTTYYNYAQFMNHYYWVDDVMWLTNDIQEVHCHLDPLGTYKNAIKNSYAYVQYGDSANWNKFIDDVRISPELEAPEFSDTKMFVIDNNIDLTNGTVVMRYMDCGNGGGVKTAGMSLTAFWSMLEDLTNVFTSTSTIGEITAKMGGQGSWRDNILSCMYIPYQLPKTGNTQLRLGGVTCNCTWGDLGAVEIRTGSGSIDIDWSVFNNYPFAKTSRWTSIQVCTPFGYADIPIDELRNQSKLYFMVCTDCISGEMSIKFSERTNGDGKCYAYFSGGIGVSMMDMLGTGIGFKQGLGNAIKYGAELGIGAFTLGASMGSASLSASRGVMSQANAVGATGAEYNEYVKQAQTAGTQAAIASGISSVSSCIPTGVGNPRVSGGGGSGLSSLCMTSPYGYGVFVMKGFRPLMLNGYTDFCDMYGYPVNYYLQLSSITGFCKCCGASVQNCLGATEANKSTINSYLNSGIYIED